MSTQEKKLAIAKALGLSTDRLADVTVTLTPTGPIEVRARYICTSDAQLDELIVELQSVEFAEKPL